MTQITHKLFLDDSGNKEYDPDGDYSHAKGKTPYFVFGGLLLESATSGAISVAVEAAKIEAFGRSDVEVKANWLKRPKERKAKYLDPFGIDDAKLNVLTKTLYEIICEHQCELVACVVNKAEAQEQYGKTKAWYAPAIAYECVMQRVQRAMMDANGYAHVTIDDMAGSSPKGRDWKENLIRHHGLLRSRGSQLIKGMVFDRIVGDKPVFRDSALEDRIQLADIVSYAVYRQFVDHGPDWEDSAKPLPTYDYFQRICGKFRNSAGRIQGYGIVKFPMKNRVRWSVTK